MTQTHKRRRGAAVGLTPILNASENEHFHNFEGRHIVNKLTLDFQKKFVPRLIFDESIFQRIDPAVKLHEETKCNPLSSCAACLNVIGSLAIAPAELARFLGSFGLEIEDIYKFPSPVCFDGRTYHDEGYAVIERLKRYSGVLAELRKHGDIPFDFDEEYRPTSPKSYVGMYDFSPDHIYQLMRLTLLARTTTGKTLGDYTLEDYRIVHLTHSQNDRINILHPEYLVFSPGLQRFSGRQLHDVWKELLCPRERERFVFGHWDAVISRLKNDELRTYLSERYV